MKNLKQIIIYFFTFAFFLLTACGTEPNTPLPPSANVETDVKPLALLPDKVKESSGIAYKAQHVIYTHNDAGGEAELYEVRTDEQKMVREISIENAENEDWEDIADDDTHIYIGDVGNNKGDRTDLGIYAIKKTGLLFGTTSAAAEKIAFHYPEQTIFDWPDNIHNFDCEAMISVEEHLYLFSKNIADKQCKLYQLSKNTSPQETTLIETFDTEGWITGADINREGTIICLVGYNKNQGERDFAPFIWILSDFTAPNFFSGETKRVELAFDLHVESIAAANNGIFLISTEKEGNQEAQVFEIDVEKWIE